MTAAQTVTLCRVSRQKLGNPLVRHHGFQILAVDGAPAVWTDPSKGTRIPTPIIDYNANSSLLVKSPEEFAVGHEVIAEHHTTLESGELTRRLQTIAEDQRPYDLIENNCETKADTVVEGQPRNRQIIEWGVLLGVVALVIGLIYWSRRSTSPVPAT
ncbi:MAG: hypothetical protein J0M02_06685 [Planctomycetes bacterium]|nr:hypothetical protein [Planctomycetota bacterium]